MANTSPVQSASSQQAPDIRRAVIRFVLENIQKGEWSEGDRLPVEAELADHFGTPRSNINQALKELEQVGIVRRYRRRGTFVERVHPTTIEKSLRRVTPTATRIHIIAPSSAQSSEMHWNAAALCQLEMIVNGESMQVVHHICPDGPTPEQFSLLIEKINQEPSCGIVVLTSLVGSHDSDDSMDGFLPFVESLLKYPGRICLFNRTGASMEHWPFDAVSLTPLGEGIAVGRYLTQHNVQRAICVGVKGRLWSESRIAGIRLSVGEVGQSINMESSWIENFEANSSRVYNQILDAIETSSDCPTVIVPNDHHAAKLLDLAHGRNIDCPKAFCLISFDNNDRYRQYNITSVAPPANRIGEVIGQLICDQVARPANAAINLKLKSVIVERGTFAQASS